MNGLLAAGMVVGAVLAAAGLAPTGRIEVTDADLQRALTAVESDRRAPLDEATRRHVHGRLVDEAVLVERAIELGLPRADRQVRADLVAAMISLVTARADQSEPSEDALRAFHAANAALFRTQARVHVRAWHGGERVELPDAPIPPAKLRDYLGPSRTDAALALPVGERRPVGDHTLLVVDRELGAPRAFEEVRDLARAAWRHRAADRALRVFLDEQRRRYRVVDP